MINLSTPIQSNIQFHDGSKEVMRITSEGITVLPDVTVDEASKAVIAALDDHIKHVVAERDALLREAMAVLELWSAAEGFDDRVAAHPRTDAAIAAIKGLLK